MLVELRVRDLGVIGEVTLLLGRGMTALTGETGAGKTMLVDAIELLVGGRADTTAVRAGAEEAVVEGRFVVPGTDDEVVLGRVVPREGRSRAYIDGRLAPVSALAEWGARLVDLHGQHAHQSLLGAATQRAALDAYGSVDLGPLVAARQALAALDAELAALGGDERARAREIDVLRFQVAELAAAELDDPAEEDELARLADVLADAQAHREAAAAAVEALTADGGAEDALGTAIAAVTGRPPYAAAEARLRGIAAELTDVAHELRAAGEGIDDDPERLAALTARRQLLRELRRKYGDSLADVLAFRDDAETRLGELLDHDRRAALLDEQRRGAVAAVDEAAARVAAARRAAAPALAAAVQARLPELAMAKAVVAVDVGPEPPGDDVTFLLAANPGSAPAPLAKVASGGELARAMLAVRLVLLGEAHGADDGPSTLVFDEVDAGIGGTAALAVGRALAALASSERQVLVVTHLPQVAACADAHVVVEKSDDGTVTTARAAVVAGDDRVIELSRMLSGTPEDAATQEAARSLLASARRS